MFFKLAYKIPKYLTIGSCEPEISCINISPIGELVLNQSIG